MGAVKALRASARAQKAAPLLWLVFVALALLAFLGLVRVHILQSLPMDVQQQSQHEGQLRRSSIAAHHPAHWLASAGDLVTGQAGNLAYKQLYGRDSWPSQAEGPNQLLVLSYYHSGSSLLTRLLMLMGAYAGDGDQLMIERSNRLKWWELQQVMVLNDLLLRKCANATHPEWLAYNFSTARLSSSDYSYYSDRANGVLAYLNHKRPWVMKDPRLSWLAPLYLEHMEAPLCLLLYRQPQELVAALGRHPEELRDVNVSHEVHMERWTNATLSALQACVAVPMLVVPYRLMDLPTLEPFLALLHRHLSIAGVQGIRLPSYHLLQSQYLAHLRAKADSSPLLDIDSVFNASHSPELSDDTSSLLDLSWGYRVDMAAVDGIHMPASTETLVDVLEQHMLETLPHPREGYDYSKVAGRLYKQYVERLKEKVHRGEHHAVGLLDHLSDIVAVLEQAIEGVTSSRTFTQ